jgi:carbon monoxide dehydrogenase subunit G
VAIKFSGEFTVKKNPEEVFDFLTDPNKFAALLPDFQGLSVQDDKHFTVKVNVGISYIKGTADVRMELTESERPRRAQYKGQGAVAGGNVTMVASFDLTPSAAASIAANPVPGVGPNPEPGLVPNVTPMIGRNVAAPDTDLAASGSGTKVNWQGEAQIFGRLMSVAGGLIEPLGKKQIQKLIDGLQAALT